MSCQKSLLSNGRPFFHPLGFSSYKSSNSPLLLLFDFSHYLRPSSSPYPQNTQEHTENQVLFAHSFDQYRAQIYPQAAPIPSIMESICRKCGTCNKNEGIDPNPGIERSKIPSLRGCEQSISDTDADTGTIETMSPIVHLCNVLNQNASQIGLPLLLETLLDRVVELSVEKKLAETSSKEKSVASIGSDALVLISATLIAHVGTMSAVLEMIRDEGVAIIKNNMPTIRSVTDIFSLGRIQATASIRRTYWQAVHSIELITAANYPWLGSVLASCYCLGLAARVGHFTMDFFGFGWAKSRSYIEMVVVGLVVAFYCIKPVVWAALARVRKIWVKA